MEVNMFYSNIDHRTRVSLVLGLIFAALLRNYFLDVVFDLSSQDKNFINELFGTIFDVITTIVMITLVYFLYPVFKKNKA